MPPNAPDPQQAQESPEIALEKRELWRKALRLSTISKDVRAKLTGILGQEEVKKIPNAPPPDVIEEIYSRLIETNTSIQLFLADTYKSPGETVITGMGPLKNLVANGDSAEGRALAFLYTQAGVSAPEIFEYASDSDSISKLRNFKRIRDMYNKICANKEYINIGKKGTVDSTGIAFDPTAKGEGKIGRKQEQIFDYRKRIGAATAKTNTQPWYDAIDKLDTEIDGLEAKGDELRGELGALNAVALGSIFPVLTDIDSLVKNFIPAGLATRIGRIRDVEIRISGKKETCKIADWALGTGSQALRADRLLMNAATRGLSKPTAGMALDQLIRSEFGATANTLSSEQEKEDFYRKMKAILTAPPQARASQSTPAASSGSRTQTAASNPSAPSGEMKPGIVSKTLSGVSRFWSYMNEKV